MSRSAWMWRGVGMTLGLGLVLAELSCAGSVDVVSKGVKSVFAGSWTDTSKEVACYWEGTTRVDLAGGDATHSAYAYSPAISTLSNIYTPGTWSDGTNTHACYWIGSTLTTLASGTNDADSYATCITLEGSTIYAAGYYTTKADPTIKIPCYWTGGVRHDLTANSHSIRVTGIAVSDATVYCSGYYDETNPVACYWKGTTLHTLNLHDDKTVATDAKAYGIVYTNGDVYTVGHYIDSTVTPNKSVPCYWMGTKAYPLLESTTVTTADAYAITVSGGSGSYLYFAGYTNDGTRDVPGYWREKVSSSDDQADPTAYGLGDGTHAGRACALFASGDDLWIGGNYTSTNKVPCYWKDDGSRTDLAGGGTGNAQISFGPN